MRAPCPFDVALVRLGAKAEKIEVVGVFEDVRGGAGEIRGQRSVKVGDRGAFSAMELVPDLNRQEVATPRAGQRLLGVPSPKGGPL